ncbi:MAG: DNA polymerase/3'-5' exonuclease PolX [Pirellulales bacterium]|nr:DNA polymerase/3'-5' exonuclease PolX [Pirellulales bacterium]
MTNAEIANILDQIADLLEFQDANPFRVRAYRNAARSVRDYSEPLSRIAADPDRTLTDIAGIGKDLAEKITTLLQTGSLPMLQELLAEVPESVLAIMRVPGLGPKRAAAIYRELGVKSLEELAEACRQQRIRELKGFGAKTEESILQGLDIAMEAGKRLLWAQADQIAQALRAHLASCVSIRQMEFAGSYRRGKDTVGDLDLLVIAGEVGETMDCLGAYEGVRQVLLRGPTKMSVRLAEGLQVDLRVVPAESFGAALQYFTGSKEHNVVLRSMARSRGLKVNEYGVFRDEELIAGRTEEEVYATLELPCFPPELREARQEFDWAAAGRLPELIELGDIRGDLHAHSDWSDGIATIEEMADAAKARGLKYLAITDHSKRATIANGLDAARLRRQWAEIDQLNPRLKGFTVLKGVEVDILERGGLDFDDKLLAEADWVVASVHFGQNQSRDQITRRLIDAVKNPYVSAIAHPTGRLLGERKSYEIDLDAVLKAAHDHGTMMELNAHPKRLDLDDVACAAAKNYGVPIVVSTDSHTIDGLAAMRYGVVQARRGGLTKADVANTRTLAQLQKLLRKKR